MSAGSKISSTEYSKEKEGTAMIIRIKAGIKDNGIASTRVIYPLYSSFIIDEQEFIADQTILINPQVNYLDSAEFFFEDFEGIGIDIEATTMYCNPQWFFNLHLNNLRRLYRNLEDLWNYRLEISNEIKSICIDINKYVNSYSV